MKKLLCLLSDQPIANLLSVHQFKPDFLVLLETPGMRRKNCAENFIAALIAGGLDYSQRVQRLTLLEEDSIPAMRECLSALPVAAEDDWIVNLTGGTKTMSMGAYSFFHSVPFKSAMEPQLIYMNAAKPDSFSLLDSAQSVPCSYTFNIDEFLAAYGFSAVENPIEPEKQKLIDNLWECSRLIAAKLPLGKILDGNMEVIQQRRKEGAAMKKNFLISALRESVFPFFNSSGRPLDNQEWGFLFGEWMEVFFAGLMLKNAGALQISDVRIGLQIVSNSSTASTEFDVAFMRKNALHVIECKCGTIANVTPNEHMDRLAARARQFRALRVKAFFASNSPMIQDRDGAHTELMRERASLYDIVLILLDEIHKLAQNTGSPEAIAQIMSLR